MGGISSFIGAIALIGFVIFLIGAATVVLAASQGRRARGGIALAGVGLVIGILFSIVSNGLLFVNVSEIAVITNTLTGNLENPREAGTSVIIPGLQLPTFYPISRQEYTMSANPLEGETTDDDAVEATTVDGQSLRLDVTIFYNINADSLSINEFHRTWSGGQENRWRGFIRSTVRTVVRDVVATFRAADIYGAGRVQMQARINQELEPLLTEAGFTLDTVNVRGLQFSATFVEAIEAAAASEQRAIQARQEAERSRTIAQGERDAAIARAEGEAQSIILRAEAEAESLRLVSEQLAANPLLVQYQYIQTLGPNVRLAIIPSNSPFLFDLESIAANPDFIAPDVPETDLVLPTPTPIPTATPGS
jgi:regulator of protease activity HflC (stomatin/prohibitin superfamily)